MVRLPNISGAEQLPWLEDKVRVLLLSNRFPNPAKPYAAMFVQRHIQLHQKMGVEFQIITPDSGPQPGVLRKLIRQLSFIRQVLQALLFSDFDLVHAHWAIPSRLSRGAH